MSKSKVNSKASTKSPVKAITKSKAKAVVATPKVVVTQRKSKRFADKVLPEEQFQVKRLNTAAISPTRGSKYAAGYDLYSCEETVIPKRGRGLVATGIAIKVPKSTYGRVAPRSGLTVKNGIDTGAGVIDEDYRGEVKVVLFNHTDEDFTVAPGDRVAQLVLERIVTPEIFVVEELDETIRGEGGFGSTGTN